VTLDPSAAVANGDRITIKGMRFHTLVGLLPHEQSVPQPLELDVSVWLSLRHVGESDSPKALLDYRDLYDLVARTVGSGHIKLLEALCEKIAGEVLEGTAVERVRVAARKPHVPIDGPVDYVEVVVDRSVRDRG
jgi:dihydroneopterin aldolase